MKIWRMRLLKLLSVFKAIFLNICKVLAADQDSEANLISGISLFERRVVFQAVYLFKKNSEQNLLGQDVEKYFCS